MAVSHHIHKGAEKIADLNVIIVLDMSLSLRGQRIGSLYTGTLEFLESMEDYCDRTGRDVSGDILLMGIGDEGDECEWLCGDMVSMEEIHDTIEREFLPNGHTVILKAIESAGQRIIDSRLPQSRTAVIFITDGEFGFVTKEEAEEAILGNMDSCSRMALLVGHAYDEDVVRAIVSDEEWIFHIYSSNALFNCLSEIMDGRERF